MRAIRLRPLRFSIDLRKSPRAREARKRRYHRLCQLVGLRPQDRVLDVGCGQGHSFEEFNRQNEIVGLDIDSVERIIQDNFQFVKGDATSMTCFDDNEFDVVVCIGVLPRVTPYANLRRAAGEIARVGKAFAVVVPHMFTFVDPYSHLPLWQFSPRNLRTFLRRRDSSVSQEISETSSAEEERLFYLRARDWQALFPESTVVSHRYMTFGIISDFIIYKRRTPQVDAEASERR